MQAEAQPIGCKDANNKKAVLLDGYTPEGQSGIGQLLVDAQPVRRGGHWKRACKLLNIERQQSGVEGSGRSLSLITQTADAESVAD